MTKATLMNRNSGFPLAYTSKDYADGYTAGMSDAGELLRDELVSTSAPHKLAYELGYDDGLTKRCSENADDALDAAFEDGWRMALEDAEGEAYSEGYKEACDKIVELFRGRLSPSELMNLHASMLDDNTELHAEHAGLQDILGKDGKQQ